MYTSDGTFDANDGRDVRCRTQAFDQEKLEDVVSSIENLANYYQKETDNPLHFINEKANITPESLLDAIQRYSDSDSEEED